MNTKYVVVTPVRDEQDYLPLTIESMVRQTVLPVEWIVVNDGSKDRTRQIIDEAAQKYCWIRGVHRQDRGHRKWGGGIIEAFYDGYDALECRDWHFMSKLDGDLSFPPTYFEDALGKFKSDGWLGIGGGVLYHVKDGKRILENHPVFHVRGGTKIFRRECWEAIEGLWVGPGSDTVDDVKANMLGWKTMSFFDLQMTHHRWTGETYGRWGGLTKYGKTDYVTGYHPLFFLAKTAARLGQKPYVLGSLALLCGYFKAYLDGTPRVDDRRLVQYLRKQQLAKLMRRETIWK